LSDFIIHSHPASPFMRSVCIALEEKAVPYRIQSLVPGEMRSEAYRKLHPFGRMPVIVHGDYRLYETQAILRYIDALFPDPALQPAEPQAIGRMNQIIGITDWYLFHQVARILVFHRIVSPRLLGTAPDEAACAAAVPDAEVCLGELNRLLGKQTFIAGDRLTLADIHLAPQLVYLAATPECEKILQGTALSAWLARMEARPSMQATLPPADLHKAG
jgi:glutathione S-transferase